MYKDFIDMREFYRKQAAKQLISATLNNWHLRITYNKHRKNKLKFLPRYQGDIWSDIIMLDILKYTIVLRKHTNITLVFDVIGELNAQKKSNKS